MMTTPNNKQTKKEEEMSPYTEKEPEEVFDEHASDAEGYKSPYVTEEPEADKSSVEAESPYTEPDAQKTVKVEEEDLSPYTETDEPASSSK
ncbi:MAG: hypothetical protein ACK2UW_03475 [Anaerolineales bacterium]|jgi:hypothetical protein